MPVPTLVLKVSLLILLTCLLGMAPSLAASEPLPADETIGLVLGGGGARGAAHVGVLKVLEEQGIVVDLIVGTSMGAIVGSLYASGYRPDEIQAILDDIDWTSTLRDQSGREMQSAQRKADAALVPSSLELGIGRDGLRTPQGLLQGQNLGLLLRRLLLPVSHIEQFDDLPIPFRAVAADLVNGEVVVLDSGDLVNAVRASMSVPGIFQPLRIDGHILVDGGVVDNVPVDVARAMGADRLIVVDVGAGLASEEELGSPASVTLQVISILMERNTRQTLDLLGEHDVLIRPDLGDIGSADFPRASEAVPFGEVAARENLEQLAHFQATSERRSQFAARPHPEWSETRLIRRIEVEKAFSRTAFLVNDRMRPLLGQPASPDLIEQQIAGLYGEGHYERISYLLVEDDEEMTLRITPMDKSWGPNFLRLGLRLSDDFDGGSAYQLDALARLASDIRPGAEWRLRLALGELNELGLSWRMPLGTTARNYFTPYASARAINQPLFIGGESAEIARLRWTRGRIGADLGHDWNNSTRGFLRVERGQDRLARRVGQGIPRFNQDYGFLGVGLRHDSLDDATFPRRGLLLDGRMEFYQPWLGSDTSAEVVRFELTKAWSADRYLLIGGLRAVSALNDDVSLQAVDFLGGLGNLSGHSERELSGPQLFLARTLLMRRIGDGKQLLDLPTYVGVSLEAGNVWIQRSDFDLDDLIYAGSLYIGVGTPLGPVFLGYGHSSESRRAIYLTFGSLIQGRH